jgi:tetrahydromethanopterin S-methyltransferase subunit E
VRELFYLMFRLYTFFSGWFSCLYTAFNRTYTFGDYLSIGLGVIIIFISLFGMRKVETHKLKVFLCCYCPWRTSRNFEIICCWCTKFKTWIPIKYYGVKLYTKKKSI